MKRPEDQLDRRLKDTMEKWANQGQLPQDRVDELLDSIADSVAEREPPARAGRRRSRLLRLAAAVGLVTVLLAVPQVRAWATDAVGELPFVGQFIQQLIDREPGWEWATREGALQTVVAVDSHAGYTLRVHRLLVDPTQTGIVFSVEGDEPASSGLINQASVRATVGGSAFSARQKLESRIIDGVWVARLELEPLPENTHRFELSVVGLGEHDNQWRVTIPVREGTATPETQYIELDQDIELAEGLILHVERAVLSPVQTVIEARYQGPEPAPDLFGSGLQPRLVADSQFVAPRSPYGTGGQNSSGETVIDYRFEYERLPLGTKSLSLVVPGALVQVPVTTELPVTEGATAAAEGGWELRIDQVSEDAGRYTVMVSYPHDYSDPWRPYEEWSVVDSAGERRHVFPRLDRSQPDQVRLEFVITLPEGRTPARLESQKAWVQVEGPWKVDIPVDKLRME